MSFIQAYLMCATGVIVSIVLPVLANAVRDQFSVGGPVAIGGFGLFFRSIWKHTRPYMILGAFSLLVSLLVVAFLGDTLTSWREALIAGYLWEGYFIGGWPI